MRARTAFGREYHGERSELPAMLTLSHARPPRPLSTLTGDSGVLGLGDTVPGDSRSDEEGSQGLEELGG